MHEELISFTQNLVKSICKEPDMVSGDDGEIMLEIIVHESDMGAVIGRSGKMASSIRTLVQAYAYIHELKRVKINIDSF